MVKFDGNNSLDQFGLYADDGVAGNRYIPLFTCRAQTVCNLEGLAAGSQSVDAKYSDTLAPGPFQLRAFVDPRQFWCQPHGVCNARTLGGDTIGPNCVTRTNPNRWLMHDWRKLKPAARRPGLPRGMERRVHRGSRRGPRALLAASPSPRNHPRGPDLRGNHHGGIER